MEDEVGMFSYSLFDQVINAKRPMGLNNHLSIVQTSSNELKKTRYLYKAMSGSPSSTIDNSKIECLKQFKGFL